MKSKIVFVFCLFNSICLLTSTVYGQELMKYEVQSQNALPDWVVKMYQEGADPGEIMRLYNEYYAVHPFVKNTHTQYYKRWFRSFAREQKRSPEEDRQYLQLINQSLANRTSVANWQSIGPYDWDHDAAGRSYAPGSAHVYCVEQSISNPDVLYAGTANSGLWKTIDRGQHWTPLMETWLQSTVYAIEIDHSDHDIVYVSMQNSIYKTTDGGVTFLPTGGSGFPSSNLSTRYLSMHPSNNNIVFACTNQGLLRSDNGATSWSTIVTGDFQEIEFHPTNPTIVYAVRVNGSATQFYKSTNTGLTFTATGTGWPVPASGDEQKRTEISVSLDKPNYVYAHCTGSANGGSGLYGVYISSDQGANWTFQCCGPQPAGPPSSSNQNLMGWSDEGTDDGGQYYYDMGFAVSPTNGDSIFLAGVNLWVSGNGGSSFVCPAKWSHPHKPNYVHADIHDIHYYDHTKEIWLACDGGIFYSNDNGANFQRRVVGITGTDFWGFGQGWWHGDVMLGGAYHNGTMLKEGSVYNNDWLCTDGGDGTLGFVNPGLDRQVYGWFDIKMLQSDRTIAPVTRAFNFKPNNTYITGKSNDLLIDPTYYTHWLTGNGTTLYKTEDNGYSFTSIYDFGEDLAAMAQCWTAPNVIYVCTFPDWWATKHIYKTTDGGANWTDITPPSATINGNTWIPYDIAVDHDDPNKVWIVRTSMYDSNVNGYTAYYSENGGTTWQNISGTGLNGQSPTSLFLQKGADNSLYIGTRKAVFYKNDNMTDWVVYNQGLPAQTHCTKVEGYYREQKLRNASTRSVWETPYFQNSTPIAHASVHTNNLFCSRDTAYFVDHSVLSDQGVSWNWSFPGGSPSTSSDRSPKVTYSLPGTYDVSLTVADDFGSSTKTFANMITIENKCSVDTIPGKALLASGTNKHGLVNDVDWTAVDSLTITAWVRPDGIQPDYSAIFMSDGTDAAGLNFKDGTNKLAYHWPGGQWFWNSNINVPSNQWSFVAMVVKATGITVYCNEQSATHNFTLTPTDIPSFRIGSYRNWASRNMNGMIDEVAIYNRPLTTSEIRELRHLTKVPTEDTSLIAYYQFNTDDTNDYDKVGIRHINLINGATKELSRAPIGGGVSHRLTVNGGGEYDFGDADMKMYFPTTGTYPNGEVVVSKINQLPDATPTAYYLPTSYWVVNNYGTNTTFSTLDSIRMYDAGNISGGCETMKYQYHARPSYGQGDTWGDVVDDAESYDPYPPAFVNFDNGNNVTSLGQFILVRNNKSPNTEAIEICNGIDDDCDGLIDEEYTLTVMSESDNGDLTFRAIIACAQNGDTIRFDNSIDTIFLLSPIVINKELVLLDEIGNNVVIKANMNGSGFANATFAISFGSLAEVHCHNLHFTQLQNSIAKPFIMNYGSLHMTDCLLSGEPDTVIKNELGAVFTASGMVEIDK